MTEVRFGAVARPEAVWNLVEPHISAALVKNPRFEAGDILARLRLGEMQLWIAVGDRVEMTAVTEILDYPRIRVASIVILTGENREHWMRFLSAFEEWSRSRGCGWIETWARPGWSRVLKWKETHRLLEKAL